jgi:hypothetical protein
LDLKFLIAGLICIGLFSCKGVNETGFELLEPNDILSVGYSDTLEIELLTLRVDSIRTDEYQYSLFGNYIDPAMGKVSTSTFTQFRTTGNNVFFGDSLFLDSLVLKLDVAGVYGDLYDPQIINVYKLIGSIDPGATYYSNDTISIDSTMELSSRKILSFSSSPASGPDISIRLSDSLGNYILNAGSTNLANNAAFLDFFKGLYLTTEPVYQTSRDAGAVFYLDLLSSDSRLILYYKGKQNGEFKDSLSYSFVVNNDAGRFTRIVRSEFENTLFGQSLSDTAFLGKQYVFAQAGSLTRVFARFKELNSLGTKGISRAELVLKPDLNQLGAKGTYGIPGTLMAYLANRSMEPINEASAFTSAIYDASKKEYSFTVTNFVQRLIAGQDTSYGMLIQPASPHTQVVRGVFGGVNNPTLKPVLRVVYTDLP